MRIVSLTGQRHEKRWPGLDPPGPLEALEQLRIALMAGLGRGLQSFQLPLAQPAVGDAVPHTDDIDGGPPRLQWVESREVLHVGAIGEHGRVGHLPSRSGAEAAGKSVDGETGGKTLDVPLER